MGRRGVEVAVIEAGLGGRFDATNVIPSKVQVLTSVSLEHTRWLGPTLEDIAAEKLAVVRDHGTLVTGALPPEVLEIAERTASERHATLVRADSIDMPLRAAGGFQHVNFGLAAAAAEAFLGRGLDDAAVRSAAAETVVPGRLELNTAFARVSVRQRLRSSRRFVQARARSTSAAITRRSSSDRQTRQVSTGGASISAIVTTPG